MDGLVDEGALTDLADAVRIVFPDAGQGTLLGQPQSMVYSFGSRRPELVAPASPEEVASSASGNERAGATGGQLRLKDAKPVRVPHPRLAPVAWKRVKHWEGVIVEVREDGFLAHVRPVVGGRLILDAQEFVEFGFDELLYPSDRARVETGQQFYWTLGLRKEPRGQQFYASLVRFRRQPPLSSVWLRRAEREAERLLAADQP